MKTNEFYVGDEALYEVVTGCFCKVKVLEIKIEYGKVRYLVTAGFGEWSTEKLKKIK